MKGWRRAYQGKSMVPTSAEVEQSQQGKEVANMQRRGGGVDTSVDGRLGVEMGAELRAACYSTLHGRALQVSGLESLRGRPE